MKWKFTCSIIYRSRIQAEVSDFPELGEHVTDKAF
jgi:hypothetical protein